MTSSSPNARSANTGEPRIVALEALRGVAALIVFVCHFCLAFLPREHGLLSTLAPEFKDATGLLGNPLYFALNATAAVVFFFVLSGYVLTRKIFHGASMAFVLHSAAKRWPRLALLTTLTTLICAALFLTDAYRYLPASALSGSPWLHGFAGAQFPADFSPGLFDAFSQGAWRTYFLGEAYYNTNLWTLRYELLGSYLAWGLALALLYLPRHRLRVWMLAVVAVLLGLQSVYFLSFMFGVLLARFEFALPKFGPAASVLLGLVAIYGFGYYVNLGSYSWLPTAWNSAMEPRLLIYTLCAAIVLLLFGPVGLLARFVQGHAARLLGKWSFPLYLIHTPIILSFSSWFYLHFLDAGKWTAIGLNFVLSLALVLMASALLAWIDQWWVKRMNRLFAVGSVVPD
jgi:peptidoglycan/LPS O-acetylase OafA/YrhL